MEKITCLLFSLPENKQKMKGAYTDGRNISL